MLNASIVSYKHLISEINPLIDIIMQSGIISELFIIDNSPVSTSAFSALPVTYIHTETNLGYGAAHNIAIRKSIEQNIPYHLVVNPDISFNPDILLNIIQYLDNNTDIGHLMPKVFYPDGQIQYLCKLIPTPFDLIFRRFLPQSWTKSRTDKFEMRNSAYDKIMDVPYLSGCFMFLRTKALMEVGLFDERFFMYPEDIDLTRRIHEKYRTVFYPEVSIVHHHAQGSYLNFKMLIVHISNMIKYFNKWGWFIDKKRRSINNKILNQDI